MAEDNKSSKFIGLVVDILPNAKVTDEDFDELIDTLEKVKKRRSGKVEKTWGFVPFKKEAKQSDPTQEVKASI